VVFLFQAAPEIVQDALKGRIIERGQSLPAKEHDIHAGQVVLVSERFPDLAFDPVSLDRELEVPFGKHQTDPGMTEIIRCSQDQKVPVRNLQLNVVEDFAVIRRP